MAASKRKSTGKRLRFEVFKRDHFTCQYCGAQPPDVVLVIDHIDPVASGGATEMHNLMTACEPCNQGKAARDLGERQIRPDADLLYLETQQEIAELRRYQAALEERRQACAVVIESLQDLWCDCSGLDWHPADHVIQQLLDRYGPDVAESALRDVSAKVGEGYVKKWKWQAYLSVVARNMAGDQD